MSKLPTLVLYHDQCGDGFAAAWAVWRALGDDTVEYRPVRYNTPAPTDVAGKNLVIVDFCYDEPTLRALGQAAASLLVLDHHDTMIKDLIGKFPTPITYELHRRGLQEPGTPYAWFSTEKAGALLAWEFFHGRQDVPWLIRHMDDRDRWQFKIPDTREIHAAVMSYPRSFAEWDRLAAIIEDYHDYDPDLAQIKAYDWLIVEGKAILRDRDRMLEEFLANTRTLVIGGYAVPAVNVPKLFASDAAGTLAKGQPFAVAYYDEPHGRVFSLRRRDGDVHVGEVAKRYPGGGGHPGAGGFTMPFGWEGDQPVLPDSPF